MCMHTLQCFPQKEIATGVAREAQTIHRHLYYLYSCSTQRKNIEGCCLFDLFVEILLLAIIHKSLTNLNSVKSGFQYCYYVYTICAQFPWDESFADRRLSMFSRIPLLTFLH